MRNLLLPVLLLMFLVSCQEVERTPKPKDLIAEEKMVELLTEISLLHGARSYNKNLMEEKGIDPYPYLMEKYGIDSSQLVRSNNYYAENAKQYQRIYEKVKVRLESLLVHYDSIREIEERRQDSLLEVKEQQRLDSIRKANLNDSLITGPMTRDTLQGDRDSIRSLPQPVSRSESRGFTAGN